MTIEFTQRNDCALLRLNRPEALNALSFGILKDISAAIDEASSWKVHSLIVTGAGDKGVLRRRRYQGAARPFPDRDQAEEGMTAFTEKRKALFRDE